MKDAEIKKENRRYRKNVRLNVRAAIEIHKQDIKDLEEILKRMGQGKHPYPIKVNYY